MFLSFDLAVRMRYGYKCVRYSQSSRDPRGAGRVVVAGSRGYEEFWDAVQRRYLSEVRRTGFGRVRTAPRTRQGPYENLLPASTVGDVYIGQVDLRGYTRLVQRTGGVSWLTIDGSFGGTIGSQ